MHLLSDTYKWAISTNATLFCSSSRVSFDVGLGAHEVLVCPPDHVLHVSTRSWFDTGDSCSSPCDDVDDVWSVCLFDSPLDVVFNVRRMHEVTVITLCVCVSVTTLALTYDVCATNLAYQCSLRCTQKVLNWAISLKSLNSFSSYSFFSPRTTKRVAICKLSMLTTAFSKSDNLYLPYLILWFVNSTIITKECSKWVKGRQHKSHLLTRECLCIG